MLARDVFPHEVDEIEIGATRVRKGTVLAFAHNAHVLERADPTSKEHAHASKDLRKLAAQLGAAGMFEVFTVKLPRAAKIVEEALGASHADEQDA